MMTFKVASIVKCVHVTLNIFFVICKKHWRL